ncbi:MAG: JAB domain-containing protein [Bdellovibrionales bacterium]|nr:JAB domain-containing protein [Bdellovibrionales bacterium]
MFCSQVAEKYLRPLFSWEAEEVWILGLSSSKSVIQEKLLFRGTVDSCEIHARDIFRFCCQVNASSFLLAHNHPLGDEQPSERDEEMTAKLYSLSLLIQIPLTDHLVLSRTRYFSFAESSLWTAYSKMAL